MAADDDINASLNGVVGGSNNVPLSWRPVYARARTVIGNILQRVPFNWPPGGSPSTTSTYDQVQATAEQVSWRYVDAHGGVWDQKAVNLILVEWLLDGAPTPLTLAKIAQYWKNAGVLRPWPTGFPGAFPGEPQQTYPAFPPAAS